MRLACVLALAAMTTLAQAGSIEAKTVTLNQTEDGTTLSAEFNVDLGFRLEDAVSRGVPLYFTLEFELTRPRWWWSNEYVVSRTITYRLSYAALTRQYRLSTGNLHRNFSSLEEALRVLSTIGNMSIADKGTLKIGEPYAAGIRMSLDRSQLPKPFQVDAIGNRDWHVDSHVYRWTYVPSAVPVATSNNAEVRP
ncbi:MAG TPA: DUF4390 domain-containing protein [Rhodocyclaceae bacterium]|nr:DUF4390 domain-containing protein [Rhodocyclaceae bacterium]